MGDGTRAEPPGPVEPDGARFRRVRRGRLPAERLIAKGMTTVALSGAVSTGTVLNPVDYEGMLLARTEGSGERLDSAGAFESPADTMW